MYIYLVYFRGGVANVTATYIWCILEAGLQMSGLYLVYIRGGVANVRVIYTWCILEEGLQMSGLYIPGVY